MAFVKTAVEINGMQASLSEISECFSVLQGDGLPQAPGTKCSFTIVAQVMGKDDRYA